MRVHLAAMGGAREIALIARPLRKLGIAHEPAAELREFPLVLNRDQHQGAVSGGEGAIGADRRVGQANTLRDFAGTLPIK